MTWDQVEPRLYGIVAAFGLGIGPLLSLGIIRAIATALGAAALFCLSDYAARTRWSGRPIVLITTEAAKAIQDGRYNLKTPPKEQLH
jgi:hypothetical protein